jgi:glycosyltransferase involved in cell wall biosynthesis
MLIFFYITLFFLFAYGFLIEFYRRSWHRVPSFEVPDSLSHSEPEFVSVIVPARNEEKNIGKCLQSLIMQVYPKDRFEIIVVDDHSTDQTASIVQHFNHPSVKLIRLENEINGRALNSYKKKALESAIAVAKGEWILTTDADCILPVHWIQFMASMYHQQQAAFIAAPVKIAAKSSLLSVFQCLDFVSLQGITAASIYRKIHAMCNGANLGFQKKIFFEVDGFRGIDQIASGDDMFLMSKISKRYPHNIFFMKSRDAIVVTESVETWRAFLQQRIRWASKTGWYEDRAITPILFFVWTLNASILFFLIASIWNPVQLFYFFSLWLAKTLFEFPFVFTIARFFEQQQLMRFFFFLQPLHIIYTVIAGTFGTFGSYQWKGRKVK